MRGWALERPARTGTFVPDMMAMKEQIDRQLLNYGRDGKICKRRNLNPGPGLGRNSFAGEPRGVFIVAECSTPS